jgi:tRNA(Ile)-lysidine synthase
MGFLDRLIRAGERVVVACSGGVDSVVLADAVCALAASHLPDVSVTIAHLDHGLREDGVLDFELVKKLAEKLGVPFKGKRIELGKTHDTGGIEEKARNERYAFLAEVAEKCGADAVLTGHHADDQVETVLFRLLRGTGITGLAGIPETREIAVGVRVVRPLLIFTRKEIAAYAGEKGLAFREDSTNLDTRFQRNRIRRELVPMLEKFAPGFGRSILSMAASARDASDALEAHAKKIINRARIKSEKSPAYKMGALKNVDKYTLGRLLDESLAALGVGRKGLDRSNYEDFFKLVASRKDRTGLSLPGNISALIDRGTLYFRLAAQKT